MGVLVLKTRKATLYVVLLLCCVLTLGIVSGRRARELVQQTAAMATQGPVIMIDPGHGGEDGGATGAAGSSEAALNLEISSRLRSILRLLGQNTRMTREADVSIHDADADTISEKKVSDLHNRAALVNRTADALLLSIHQNHFPEKKYSGAQVFYAPAGESQRLAELLQQLLREQLDPQNRRAAKLVDRAVYLMNHIECTGVLVECGFLSNPGEEARLCTEEYQKKLAAVIAAATLQFMEATNEV